MAKLTQYFTLKIIALSLGFLPAAFFLFFLIGEGLAELFDGKMAVIPILVLMLFTVSGYLLAWQLPRSGGIMMITGGLAMGIYLIVEAGSLDLTLSSGFALPFIIPGLLFMLIKRVKSNN